MTQPNKIIEQMLNAGASRYLFPFISVLFIPPVALLIPALLIIGLANQRE